MGTAIRSFVKRQDSVDIPLSYAYFCPTCGEVWARAVCENRPFFVWTVGCRKHQQYNFLIAGSLMLPLEPDFNAILPLDVLKWELERHIDFYLAKEAA